METKTTGRKALEGSKRLATVYWTSQGYSGRFDATFMNSLYAKSSGRYDFQCFSLKKLVRKQHVIQEQNTAWDKRSAER